MNSQGALETPFEEVVDAPPEGAPRICVPGDKFPSGSSWREKLQHWTGIDRAIGFIVLARIWAAFGGVTSILLNAHFLTASEQGYYYAFYSLVALQIVFELGFGFVVMQLVAHERAYLTFSANGAIAGDAISQSRLASVLRLILRWYFMSAFLMVAILLPVGFYFFDGKQHGGLAIGWRGPWSLLVLLSAIYILLFPVVAFVEGCGFVPEVAQMNLGQVVLGSVLAWGAMISHHGLYSPAMMSLGYVLMQVRFLSTPRFRRMLLGLLRRQRDGHAIEWRQEIFPFQWRIAITWISNYCMSQMLTTLLFSCQGPQAAGRMGMSMSVITQLGAVGLSWMSTKASPFGNMIARGEIRDVNRVFRRTLFQSTTLVGTGALTVFLCVLFVGRYFPQFAVRLLPPSAFALLLLTMVMSHVLSCEALYMRAHKKEPLIVPAVVVSVLLAIATVVLGRLFSVEGVALGYFILGGIVSLTWGTYIFRAKKREWYGSAIAPVVMGELENA